LPANIIDIANASFNRANVNAGYVKGNLIATTATSDGFYGNTANISGNVYAPAIVQIGAQSVSIELNAAAGIIGITSSGNQTQFLPSGQINLGGSSQITGGTFSGSGITLGTSQTDLFQNRGGNVTVQVGTSGSIANTWTFAQNGSFTSPGKVTAAGVNLNDYTQAAFDKANTAGISLTDNTTINADTYYPTLANTQTTGSASALEVSSTKLYYNPSTGQLNATNFNSLSDQNLKKNVITLDNAIGKVNKLRGVSFDWKETNIHSIGVIAQEVEQVLPEVVSTNKDGEKSVNYGNIVGLLIEAIKEQQVQIDELKSKVK
jgi:hypothetical protein